MANQIVVSAGAKVRDLQDVIIGTSGVLSSLAFDVANGVPRLDVNGKILVSQLPNSVMEYKGTWNVSTNTPTLVNGTGNQGDVYLVEGAAVGGTAFNFGAGPITFFNGDQAIYSGSIWQRASGATGTVTSVAITESGDSLNITGSPITTSGTINIGFNGTNLQYVNGAGNLTTFPTLMTSVGLTMPSAFTVTNSPLTGAGGTLAVTGAGYASQYIRGDGTLADFPSSGGGGSSVSYYLNGGTSQGTIGGVTYYEMSKTADTGTGVDFTKSGDGFIVAFLTDANDPAQLNIPAGNWNYEIYASMSANGGTPQMYAELYKYDGTTFTLISTSSNEILYDGTNLNLYTFGMTVPATTLTLNDRLAIKLYATNSGGKTTTVHTQDSHLCQVITTFSTGITALNGLTAQVQYFQVGTSGTDFNISSTTATHSFNIPDASATARGLITTGTQTIAGIKTFSNGLNSDYIGVTGDIGMDGSFSLKQVAFGTLQSGYTNLSGQTNGLRVGLFGGYNALLNFSTSGSYTYTFPSATGTVALTSDLSSYVPTSRTLTINGTGYDLSADRSWTINSMVYPSAGIALSTGTSWGTSITDNSANWNTAYTNRITSATAPLSIISNVIAMSEATGSVDGYLSRFDWTTFNNKQATITLTTTGTSGAATFTSNTLNIPNYGSALSGYLPLTGGTLTGALNGTSASFSSTGRFIGALTIGTDFAQLLPISASNYQLLVGSYYDGTNIIATATSGSRTVYNVGGIDFRTFTGATVGSSVTDISRFSIIASTGAAAFTSSVTLTNGRINLLGNTSDSKAIMIMGDATYPTASIVAPNTGGTILIAGQSGTGMTIGTTGAATFSSRILVGNSMFLGEIVSSYSLIETTSGNGIWLRPAGGSDPIGLKIATTGAATFSSSVSGTSIRSSAVGTFGFNTANNGEFQIYATALDGIIIAGRGSTNDMVITNKNGNDVLRIPTGTTGITLVGALTGTSATFSGIVTSNQYFDINGTSAPATVGSKLSLGYYTAGGYAWMQSWSSTPLILNPYGNNVGIGGSTAAYQLDVTGTFRATGAATFSSTVTATSYNRAAAGTGFLNGKYGSAESVSTTGPIYCIGDSYVPTSTSINGMFGIGYSYNQFTGKFGPADTWGMYVATNGSVGVFLAGGGAGYFAGAVTATGFFESSDKRIKTLIEDNYQTKGIGEITPKLYTKNGKVELGYYAQDFVGILDSAISKIDDGMLNLSYREVHTAKIYALEQEIKELKAKLN